MKKKAIHSTLTFYMQLVFIQHILVIRTFLFAYDEGLRLKNFPINEKVEIIRNIKTRNKRNFQQTNMLRFIYHWANMAVFCNKHESFQSIFSSWWQRWCNFTTLSISCYDCVAKPWAFMTISKKPLSFRHWNR